ncbi:MAG: carbohydrate ABC transporter permease [Spirochaetales bacterium]|nr:carbohydrate ABC transporter permease [Spirochaetales bacterium]
MMSKKKYPQWILFSLVVIGVALYVMPLYFSFISALKSNGEIMRDPTAMPKNWLNFDNFVFLFSKTSYPQAFLNSVFLTVASELAILFVIPMTAYGIARGNKKVTPILYTVFLAAMIIPFQVFMIALFKELKVLGLYGNFGGPIMIYLSGSIPFGVLLFTSFLKTIPFEIEEAATIDGCGVFHTFWRIIFPLLKPVTASMIILNGLNIWNDFLMPMLVLPSHRAKTVNVEIFAFIDQFASRWDVVFAGVVCGLVPVFIVFVSLQKYFVKGLTTGAAKG